MILFFSGELTFGKWATHVKPEVDIMPTYWVIREDLEKHALVLQRRSSAKRPAHDLPPAEDGRNDNADE